MWTEALTASLVSMAKAKLEDVLLKFTEAVSIECNIDKSVLCAIWNKVAPDCAMDLQSAIERENKKKELEVKKTQKKKDEEKGPHCQYVFGDKAKRSNEECGEACKDVTTAEDGKCYCSKHRKQVTSKHTCCFIFGEKAKKSGQPCGARITKDSTAFDREGEYEGHEYNGEWLCKRHNDQVNKALDRFDNRCTHVFSEKSQGHAGEQCKSIAKSGGKCAKHVSGGKKEKVKKDEKEQRKVLKNGEDEVSNEEEEEVKPKKTKTKKAESKEKKVKGDSDSRKKEKEKKSKVAEVVDESESQKSSSSSSTTLTVKKIHFPAKAKELKFVARRVVGQDDIAFIAFIDMSTGLTCVNTSNPQNTEVVQDKFFATGVWNNDEQIFDSLTEEAVVYCGIVGIPVDGYESEEGEEDAEQDA